jgi:hypothetical protein
MVDKFYPVKMQWMDFIMLNCKKPETGTYIILSALMSLLLLPASPHAELHHLQSKHGFIVESAELNSDGVEYTLNADIQFHFSKEALKALEHGIALQIDIEVQAKQNRKWLWDKKIRKKTLSQRLEHQPLSDQYLVTDLNTGIKRNFHSFHHALEFLGSINDYPFLELASLQQGKTYTALVRASLNKESLPAPLRLSAYVSSDWQLSSPWYRWAIQQ